VVDSLKVLDPAGRLEKPTCDHPWGRDNKLAFVVNSVLLVRNG